MGQVCSSLHGAAGSTLLLGKALEGLGESGPAVAPCLPNLKPIEKFSYKSINFGVALLTPGAVTKCW